MVNYVIRHHKNRNVKKTFDICAQRISAIWSVFVVRMKKLCILAIENAPSQDSDQTVHMYRLIWIFAGHSSEGTFSQEQASEVFVNVVVFFM